MITIFAVVAVRCAWLCDDAYITFRTVRNFAEGYGLTWNAGERVQVYSHPLWMLLLSGAYAFTRDAYFTPITLGLALSLLSAVVFSLMIARSAGGTALGLSLLILSKAFVDYSTSGLENSLTHFLLALFCWLLLEREAQLKTLFSLALIASLGVLNRMDTLLFFAPGFVLWIWRLRSWRALGVATLGFLPFIAWEAFSLLYYGFLFPNTAYAKLDTGWPALDLIRQALIYCKTTFEADPITLITIGVGVTIAGLSRRMNLSALAAGVVLYFLYTLKVGGDYMEGRFFTGAFFVSVILIARSQLLEKCGVWLGALGAAILIGLLNPHSPIKSGSDYRANEESMNQSLWISDERGTYYRHTGLLRVMKGEASPDRHSWTQIGQAAREQKVDVVFFGAIGLLGWAAGPDVYVLDTLALADPLLSHLPARRDRPLRVGHFERLPPDGYVASRVLGKNVIKDEKVAAYYDQLSKITSGPLWTKDRLAAIAKMNFRGTACPVDEGQYSMPQGESDPIVNYNIRAEKLSDSSGPIESGKALSGVPIFPLINGVRIYSEKKMQPAAVELVVANGISYEVEMLDGKEPIFKTTLNPSLHHSGDKWANLRQEVPPDAQQRGFDSLWIRMRYEGVKLGWLASARFIP